MGMHAVFPFLDVHVSEKYEVYTLDIPFELHVATRALIHMLAHFQRHQLANPLRDVYSRRARLEQLTLLQEIFGSTSEIGLLPHLIPDAFYLSEFAK